MSKQRLIDANKLKKATEKYTDCANIDCINCFRELIDNAPTVEPTYQMPKDYIKNKLDYSRPQGEWIFMCGVTCGGYYKCNKCGEVERAEKNFCSNCGAKMRGDDNGKS